MRTLQIRPNRLSAALNDPKIEVMNFLNEVAMRHPRAISFAPGRPPEDYFAVAHSQRYIEHFMRHGDHSALHKPDVHGMDALGQYGRTNGIVSWLIANMLATDEGIEVDPEDIVLTVGAQEAICLCLSALCRNPGDVVLSIDPAYIGLSGAARILGIEVAGVPAGKEGIDLSALETIVDQLVRDGKSARLLYLSSDYANPNGLTLSIKTRVKLLEAARALDLILIEDSAYNYFCYEGDVMSPLKSLEGGERVIFVGSFAKTVYPGLRLGFLAAGQRVSHGSGQGTRLSEEISKIKSLLTVNTSPLMQALVGGLLIQHDCSLRQFVQPRVQALKANRDAMLAALEKHFPRSEAWCAGISWNRPAGGFFLTLTLPVPVGHRELLACAAGYGVTWTPMAYFNLHNVVSRQIRLSFSYVKPTEIHEGIARVASWAKNCGRSHGMGNEESLEHNATLKQT